MMYSSQLIITTISLFEIAKGRQPWPSQDSIGPLPVPRKVDLELCMLWPWQGRSILQMDVIRCKANEKCVPIPNTQIYGLNLGYASYFEIKDRVHGCIILQKYWYSLQNCYQLHQFQMKMLIGPSNSLQFLLPL